MTWWKKVIVLRPSNWIREIADDEDYEKKNDIHESENLFPSIPISGQQNHYNCTFSIRISLTSGMNLTMQLYTYFD